MIAMCTRIGFGLGIVVALQTGLCVRASAVELYVATDGNDAWSGKRRGPNAAKTDGPFATLTRARDEIRRIKKTAGLPGGGVTVLVRGGVYRLDSPLELTAADSGAKQAPISYRALPGEAVRLIGGRTVTGFGPVKDPAILKRLDPAARSKVLRADLKALGITDYGSPKGGGLELFFQDRPMTVARWPNEGFVRIVEEAGGKKYDIRGRKGDRIGKWVYDGDRPKRWTAENEVWVHGYWFWDWSAQRHKVKAIDTAKRLIEVEPPYHGYGYRKGQWYYAYNILAEIDSPGEWYVDRKGGVVYFWPPAPIDSGTVVVSVLPTMVTMKEVSHVTLRGMIVGAARGTAIRMSGGTANRIVGCTLRNIGGGAVAVSGGTGHGVVGCDIYETGSGGISLNGGDRKTLTPAGHFAQNNHIHHYARWNRMYQTAVSLNGVGNRAAHNLIHNAPHMAIGFSGNDHVIEFNEIHSVCYESNDAGAMYSGRDWTMRGTVIRHNYLHDITGFEGRGCVGVYLDDMFCGTEISGNLFHRVTRAAFIGGGRDNTVENNLFVDCNPSLHIDNRAQGWASDHVGTTMKERLDAMPTQQPPWSTRYPKLVKIWKDEPAAPKGNRVVHNVSFGGKWDGVGAGARKYQTIKDNLVDVDPHFATPDRIGDGKHPRATDFALKPDSPAFAVGFKALPLDRMGLVKDDARASWPVRHKVRPAGKRPQPKPAKQTTRSGPSAGKKEPYPEPVRPLYTLAEDGSPRFVVVLAGRDSVIESHAAQELVSYVRKISGVPLAVADRAEGALRPIYLGKAARKRLGPTDWQRLGADGFVLKSNRDGVFICGARDLGTLYGTYQFLEKYLGVRWFMPGEIGEVVPEARVLQVGTIDEVSTPSFGVRWIESGEWALRNKMNVRVSLSGKEVGVKWKWGFHTFFQLIPPEKYYDDHPDWFAMVGGKRRRPKSGQQGRQLCTSNPELIKEVADNIITLFDADPTLDIIALAPQDGGGFCECKTCRALDENRPADQAWHARYSRRLATFNNAVAGRVADKHPDKLIKVGAYAMYVRVPLDADYRPAPKLAIQACHTYSCNNHRIAPPTCERNRKLFGQELERWARLTKHLFIYEYYNKGAWGGLPYYQIHVIRHDMPYYHRLGAEGFYTQPAGRRWAAVGLNHYVAAKLAWDIELDVDRILEDFYLKFYGEAAKPMRTYWQTLERAFVDANRCLSPFGLKWTTLVATDFFRPQILAALDEAVRQAERAARTPPVRKRVRMARALVDFTRKTMAYLRAIRAPFAGVDMNDSRAVRAAHQQAIALGEPLSAELRAFCKRNRIPVYERLIAAHRSVRFIVDRADSKKILR